MIGECSQTCGAFVSPDGSMIALPGAKLHLVDASTFLVTRTIRFHDVATGARGRSLPPASTVEQISIDGLAFSPHGEVLFVGSGPVGMHAISAYQLGPT